MVTGPFSLRIKASADLWQGAPKMRIWADKTLLGEVDVTAVHASGEWQDFTFTRAGLSSAAKIRIEYINDASGGTATKDRNLWIDHIEVNGTPLTPDHSIYERGTKTQAGQSAMIWGGALVFNTSDLPALKHSAWPPGGGNDTLSGGAGDDLIYGGARCQQHDGGAGTDTAGLPGQPGRLHGHRRNRWQHSRHRRRRSGSAHQHRKIPVRRRHADPEGPRSGHHRQGVGRHRPAASRRNSTFTSTA